MISGDGTMEPGFVGLDIHVEGEKLRMNFKFKASRNK